LIEETWILDLENSSYKVQLNHKIGIRNRYKQKFWNFYVYRGKLVMPATKTSLNWMSTVAPCQILPTGLALSTMIIKIYHLF